MARNAQNGAKMGISRCRQNHENENWGKIMKDVVKNRRKPLTQYDRVLHHLKAKNKITSWESITEYGITRLSAVIYMLRQDGYIISSNFKSAKNRYGDIVSFAEYTLEEK